VSSALNQRQFPRQLASLVGFAGRLAGLSGSTGRRLDRTL